MRLWQGFKIIRIGDTIFETKFMRWSKNTTENGYLWKVTKRTINTHGERIVAVMVDVHFRVDRREFRLGAGQRESPIGIRLALVHQVVEVRA